LAWKCKKSHFSIVYISINYHLLIEMATVDLKASMTFGHRHSYLPPGLSILLPTAWHPDFSEQQTKGERERVREEE
jgi:hypothetical protein